MGIRKKIKKFLAEREINKKYGKYFTEKTIKKDWDKYHLNKVALINAAVLKTLRRKKRCVYLEIGCDDNNTFNSISLPKKYKYGVDPRSGGNIKKTSDNFFKSNKIKFDIIFIDGLHEYEQCQKDVINSINFLNNDGYIFLHDLIPLNWKMELVPRIQKKWNGDVWKVAFELFKSNSINFKIADIDNGVGYFKKVNKIKYIFLNDKLKNKRFKDFLKIYNSLPIISGEKSLKNILND